jgi:hypothetical protein
MRLVGSGATIVKEGADRTGIPTPTAYNYGTGSAPSHVTASAPGDESTNVLRE